MNTKHLLPILCSLLIISCDVSERVKPDPIDQKRSSEFSNQPITAPLAPEYVNEASGMIPSKTIGGYIWIQEDSGNPAYLHLLSYDAKSLRSFLVPGATNEDWEDIASGPGPIEGTNYLYIADIGNNNGYSDRNLVIYRIPELNNINQSFLSEDLEKITFRYPDGNKDAETLLVDPLTRDILVVTKELTTTRVYRLPYPQSTTETQIAEHVATIPNVVAATGGDLSFDGDEILIRNYGGIFYWQRKTNDSIIETLKRQPDKSLPYRLEQQGEAVCFDTQAKGYYTLSEKTSDQPVNLFYYPRKGN